MKIRIFYIILIVSIFAGCLRFFQLGQIPAGVFIDEASHGYNAYSLMLTGKDEWGESFPIFLRSFGTYPSSLYTYLSIPIIKIINLSPLSIRFISAISGVILVILTFLMIYLFEGSRSILKSIVGSLFIAIAPWSILFSRGALEANLALSIVVLSILFLLLSFKKIWFFVLGVIFLAISAYAYHGERIFGVIFLVVFIFLKKDLWQQQKRLLIFAVSLFLIIQLPQFILLNKEGSTRRFEQLNYLTDDFYRNHGEKFHNLIFGKQIFIAKEFSSQYLAYFSPRNLFFDSDPQPVRSIPNLSVFYAWMMIPLIFGLRVCWKNRKNVFNQVLFAIILISPIAAAIVRDPFYTLRTLPGLWALTVIIALGFVDIFYNRVGRVLTYTALLISMVFSLMTLYSSYFILLKHERSSIYGYQYEKLAEILNNYQHRKILIDTPGDYPTYIWIAFHEQIDPLEMQNFSKVRIGNNYYGNVKFDPNYEFKNIEIRPLIWKDDIYKDQIIVASPVAISPTHVTEHKLTKIFEIKDQTGKVTLIGYSTNPKLKCGQQRIGNVLQNCLNWVD